MLRENLRVSIVIPTYNRVHEISKTLVSIINQSRLPQEIIIVDDSDDREIEFFIDKKTEEFKKKNISLKYIRNRKERSLTVAENIGVKSSTGDIVIILDDDVTLDKNYIKEIIRVFEMRPKAIGVQGHITNDNSSPIGNLIRKIFFLYHREPNSCRVYPSVNGSYPSSLDKIINCEWLAGSNQALKKEVFEEYEFDENLKKYSLAEDIDFSYRVYKKYPNSLFMTPSAKLIHRSKPTKGIPKKDLIFMKIIYKLYLFYKDIPQTPQNKISFLWSNIGIIFMSIGVCLLNPSKSNFLGLKYLIDGYIFCYQHKKEIKDGNLEFFNKTLK